MYGCRLVPRPVRQVEAGGHICGRHGRGDACSVNAPRECGDEFIGRQARSTLPLVAAPIQHVRCSCPTLARVHGGREVRTSRAGVRRGPRLVYMSGAATFVGLLNKPAMAKTATVASAAACWAWSVAAVRSLDPIQAARADEHPYTMLEKAKDVLAEAFMASHGRQPSNREVLQMRQQATLSTRPDKHVRPLADVVHGWRGSARFGPGRLGVDPCWAQRPAVVAGR